MKILLNSILSLILLASFISNAHPMFEEEIYILSMKTGKFVCAYNGAISAISDKAREQCVFKIVEHDKSEIKIYSVFHKQFLSGHGQGWVLKPIVDDETWSRFYISYVGKDQFTLQSAQPIAMKLYVSVIGELRILRIAEAEPTEWSYFIAYKKVDLIKDNEGVPST